MALDRLRASIMRADPSVLLPQLLLSGTEELLVEGYQKLLKYEETCICLQLRGMQAIVKGTGLCVKCFAPDRVLLGGRILGIELVEDAVC
jgi:sporulation protein YqfC